MLIFAMVLLVSQQLFQVPTVAVHSMQDTAWSQIMLLTLLSEPTTTTLHKQQPYQPDHRHHQDHPSIGNVSEGSIQKESEESLRSHTWKEEQLTLSDPEISDIDDHAADMDDDDTTNTIMTPSSPRIFVVIPTVRQVGDPTDLLERLVWLKQNHFAMPRVHVVQLLVRQTDDDSTTSTTNSSSSLRATDHVRFMDAQDLYDDQGVQFTTLASSSSSVQKDVSGNDIKSMAQLIHTLRQDPTISRTTSLTKLAHNLSPKAVSSEQQRTHCLDFLAVLQVMLEHPEIASARTFGDDDSSKNNKDWIIYHPDNQPWPHQSFLDYPTLEAILLKHKSSNVMMPLSEKTKTSDEGIAMSTTTRAIPTSVAKRLVTFGQEWCHWMPLEPMIRMFEELHLHPVEQKTEAAVSDEVSLPESGAETTLLNPTSMDKEDEHSDEQLKPHHHHVHHLRNRHIHSRQGMVLNHVRHRHHNPRGGSHHHVANNNNNVERRFSGHHRRGGGQRIHS